MKVYFWLKHYTMRTMVVAMQAYNMSKDHKPELKSEKERIYAAGGYIYGGRVNRTLNLARAIGKYMF